MQDQCAGHQRPSFPEVLSVWPQEPLLPHLPTGVCGQLDGEQLPGDSPAGGWCALREPCLGAWGPKSSGSGLYHEEGGEQGDPWGGMGKVPCPKDSLSSELAMTHRLSELRHSVGDMLCTCCLVLSLWGIC